MKYVKHEHWFNINIDGVEYRARYITCGYTYATFQVEIEGYIEKRKYNIFGPKIKIKTWNRFIDDAWHECFPRLSPINREIAYDTEMTAERLKTLVRRKISGAWAHTDRIE